MSYLTEAEVTAIQSLPRGTPYLITNGSHYTYHPETDELIRDDVLKFVKKLRKPKKAKVEK